MIVLKINFKTIKITKLEKIDLNENDYFNEEKNRNKIEKIYPNLLFKKSRTFTILKKLDNSQENIHRFNEKKDNI